MNPVEVRSWIRENPVVLRLIVRRLTTSATAVLGAPIHLGAPRVADQQTEVA